MTHLFDLTEEVIGAIEQRDWEAVVRDAVRLYRAARSSRLRRLAEAADETMEAALFLLEHPIFEECCASLARVMIAQLLEGWDLPTETSFRSTR